MREKILIVDNEETNLKLLAQWLIPLGYDIEPASKGTRRCRRLGVLA